MRNFILGIVLGLIVATLFLNKDLVPDSYENLWLSEEEIMMRINNEVESQYVDEDRFNVLMVMPPNSPIECESFEDYLWYNY